MAKMRMYKFWNEAGDEKEKESMSLKKAVMSVQGDFKDKIIGVEYISKKGKKINFETFLILDDILRFSKRLNKNIGEKVLWPKLCDRMIRYKPFMSYNITKYKMTLKNKIKDM